MALRDNLINKLFSSEEEEVAAVESAVASSNLGEEQTAINNQLDINSVAPTQAAISNNQVSQQAYQNPYADGFYTAQHRMINKDIEPESDLEKKARLKREKYRSLIAGLSDGIGDIANIWGASKGATAMDLTSLSDTNRKRVEYARNIRDKNNDSWRRGQMNASHMDRQERLQAQAAAEAKAKALKEWEYKLQRDDIGDKKDDIKDARAAESHGWKGESHVTTQKAAEQNYKFGAENQGMKRETHSMSKEKHKEDIANNKARTNAYVAKTLGTAAGTKPYKTEFFSTSTKDDGSVNSVVEVPKDLVDGYTANVYNQLLAAARTTGEEGEENLILSLMLDDMGVQESTPARQRNAINLYAHKYPQVKDFMEAEANKLTEKYEKQQATRGVTTPGNNEANTKTPGIGNSKPQNPNEIITEEEEEIFEKWGAQ